MEYSKLIKQCNGILLFALCLLISGCGSLFPNASASPLSPSSHIIHSGTTTTFVCGDERIGIASYSFFTAEFIGQTGEKRNEIMSRINVAIEGKPETSRDYYAYDGLIIHYFKYRIQVLRLGIDLQNRFTEVNVAILQKTNSSGASAFCT
ncbi:MAG: hypothetical protein JW748_11155 [Anaerolineales bacterium]|nr:hypothetical protein [Anaerolineales bacterium]